MLSLFISRHRLDICMYHLIASQIDNSNVTVVCLQDDV